MKRVFLACTFALAGCPTVDLGDTPPDIGSCVPNGGQAYFNAMIWPMYLHPPDMAHDCARGGCHLTPGGAGGLGFDPSNLMTDYQTATSAVYLNCGTPAASPLLTKPLAGIDGHGGGDIFTMSDNQYKVFIGWFQ